MYKYSSIRSASAGVTFTPSFHHFVISRAIDRIDLTTARVSNNLTIRIEWNIPASLENSSISLEIYFDSERWELNL